jgi:hypothetical protein
MERNAERFVRGDLKAIVAKTAVALNAEIIERSTRLVDNDKGAIVAREHRKQCEPQCRGADGDQDNYRELPHSET